MRWFLTPLVILVIGIVVLVACQSKSNVFSLKAGDCYNGPSFSVEKHTDVTNVELVNCDEPHISEVYAIFELPESSWKGDDYVAEQASIGCKARFEAFVGIEWELTTLATNYIYPVEESWKELDDRLVQCSVTEYPPKKVSGSLKGSRR